MTWVNTEHLAWISVYIVYLGAILLGPAYLNFVVEFVGAHKLRTIARCSYALSACLLPLIFSSRFIASVQLDEGVHFFERTGPFYTFFVLLYVATSSFGLMLLLRCRKHQTSVDRRKTNFVIVASLVGFLSGFSTFPYALGYSLRPWGGPIVTTYVFVIAYAITRHHLMDIELAIRDWIVYLISSGMTAIALCGIGYSVLRIYPLSAMFGVALLTGWLTPLVFPWATKILKPAIRGGRFSYLSEIDRVAEDIYRWTNLPELLRHLVQDLASRARLEWAGIWLFDMTAGAYRLQQATEMGETPENAALLADLWNCSYGPSSELVRLFETQRDLLVVEDWVAPQTHPEEPAGHRLRREAASALQETHIAAALPMFSGEKLIGFIGFGPKLQKAAFHQGDMAGLTELGIKAQHGISQAYMLYQQAKMLVKLTHDVLNFINAQSLTTMDLATERSGPLNPEQRKRLKIIARQTDLIKESMQDLLELERLVMLRMEGGWRMKPYSLGELVNTVVTAYESRAGGKGVALETAVDRCPEGIGDPRSIRRIIDNLIINALKFTPAGGKIRIETQLSGKNLRLTVSDTGAGIPPEDLPRIFDPFYQGASQKALAQGTGIGLSNVQEFVNLHKGSLRVESELGKGTLFIIELPSILRADEFDASIIDAHLGGQAAA